MTGHYKSQCKSPVKDQEEVNVVDDALICSLESNEESWVLDSGASFHATSQKELFEKYVPNDHGKLYLGDNQPCNIVGKGVVKIKLSGSTWELKDVRHIPDLKKNLISVGQLASEGYTTIFHGDDWKISKGAMTVVRGKKSGTLYKTVDARCLIYVDADSKTSNQWHQRLGHASEKENLRRVSFQKSSITAKKDRLAAEASDLEQSRPVCAEVEGILDSLMMAQTGVSSQAEELVR